MHTAALAVLAVGCGSFYGSGGPLIGYSPGRGFTAGVEVGSGLLTDNHGDGAELALACLTRAKAGVILRPASGGGRREVVLHLAWDPTLVYTIGASPEGTSTYALPLFLMPGAIAGVAYTNGVGATPIVGLSLSRLELFAGHYEYDSLAFPGIGHSHWLGASVGWRYQADVPLWYVTPTYMIARGGYWRGGS